MKTELERIALATPRKHTPCPKTATNLDAILHPTSALQALLDKTEGTVKATI